MPPLVYIYLLFNCFTYIIVFYYAFFFMYMPGQISLMLLSSYSIKYKPLQIYFIILKKMVYRA
jgi:hypothetical protein